MPAQRRLPVLAGLATGLLNALLVITQFPWDRQLLKYPVAARQYLSGQLPRERLLDFSPLYFYVHVGQEALLPGGWKVVVALQILATAGSAALLLLLLRRFVPTWAALAGVAAFALSRSVIVYAGVLEPESFLLLAVIAFLYFVTSPAPGHALLAGVSLAVCVAIRPNAVLLMLATPLLFRADRGARRWLAPTAAVLLPPLLVLLALTVRNGRASGESTPFAMNPGFVFYEGNNPLSSGRSAIYPPAVGELKYEMSDQPDSPHVGYRLIASRASGRELSTTEANRYWRRKIVAWASDQPGRFGSLLALKTYTSFHSHRFHDLEPAERFDRRLGDLWIPSPPFALLATLAVFGLAAALRLWRRTLPVFALLLSQLAILVGVYVSERQRLALLPAVLVLACFGIVAVSAAPTKKRAALVTACAILTVLLSLPSARTREDRHIWDVYEMRQRTWPLAFGLRDEGRLQEAAEAAALAFAAAPWLEDYSRPAGVAFPDGFAARAAELTSADGENPSRQLDRAQLLLAAGRLDEAEALLEKLRSSGDRFDRGFLQSSQPLHYLGRVAAARGDRSEAIRRMNEALAAAPGDPFTLAWLAALTGDDSYRRRISSYYSEVDAALLVGIAQLESGNATAAVTSLSEAVRLLPELWRAKIYLAAALGAQGDIEGAVRTYLQAKAERGDPVMLEERIVPIFAAAASESDSIRYEYGVVLAQYGRFDQALSELRAADPNGTRPEVRAAIAEVERLMSGSRR